MVTDELAWIHKDMCVPTAQTCSAGVLRTHGIHAIQVLTQQHKGAILAVQQQAEDQIAALERGAERAAQDATAACQQLCDR